MRAWWQKQGLVLIEDVFELCPEIAAIPAYSVVWNDALGRTRGDGGSIQRSSVGQMAFLYNSGGAFIIPIDTHNTYHGHAKIYLHELQLSGVSLDCIERLQAHLVTGFYQDEFEAHATAAAEQEQSELSKY